jgi:SAM-dependent methyltransferase
MGGIVSDIRKQVEASWDNPQEETWGGVKGNRYAEVYNIAPIDLNRKWKKAVSGKFKTAMNNLHFRDIPKDCRVLEVGCNVGNQLVMLRGQGWTDLHGLELNVQAVEVAKKRGLDVVQGNVRGMPFQDESFDFVYDCWCLCHIAPPHNLAQAVDEVYRVSKRWISGCGPYLVGRKIKPIRQGYLWRGDYMSYFLRRFADLNVVSHRVYPHVRSRTWATQMYVLEKKQ